MQQIPVILKTFKPPCFPLTPFNPVANIFSLADTGIYRRRGLLPHLLPPHHLPHHAPNTMLNFGVLEVANSTVPAAPGWAYVPDVGANASMSALQPSRSKRMRAQIAASPHETTAKQDAKILRELTALDRENHRDVSIPVPVRHRDNAGRGT